ncbi:ABC transporter ATP-binding protein [Pseudonocardia kunmingensis]|uniref:Amino acid/amide ABC transporter ATP-binding protein 2 (HAAT family) n=1 Tax=Pseudonocardia kunmingensis TaxID=630975 RepID=A0A543CX65_9PSEU|nr:ABC transporter ATP-binding protein [Pseudonocardia kunmingensis]TQM01629.1 amino acid/amide ABC transporter ATP-binding protein 2 (HAAT family) [Pseudonocardia kunmingensis]
MSALLEVRGVESGYGRSRVVQGVDLDVPAGEVLAVLGRNGAGKTTLINTLMGMVRLRAGSVTFDGADISGQAPNRIARAGIGFVPQGRRVFAPLSVEENLRIAVRSSGPWTLQRIYELMPNLARRKNNGGHQLSGGEQQMLAIGRALLGNPRLLLLDEPSDGLAPAVIRTIGDLLSELTSSGMSAVLVEQDLRLAFSVAGQVAVMAKGTIVHRASTRDFRHDKDTARRLLGVG